MSDDIDIRAGGVVAVDTETLRAVAARLDGLAENVESTAEAFRRATRCAVEAAGIANDIHVLGVGADTAATECRDLATAVRSSADVYEVVELTALQSAAAAAGDETAAARHEAAIDAIGWRNPDAVRQGRLDIFWRGLTWASALTLQAAGVTTATGQPGFAALGLLAGPLVGGLAAARSGTVRAGSQLAGPPPAVTVRALPPTASAAGQPPAAPKGLADAAARIPGGRQARVRVEKYTMPGGTRQFAVYVAGTRSRALGGADPFDNLSNAQAYTGERSASYQAVQQALRASGATDGDVVHAFGHSQGAMIAGLTAVEGGFDVQTLVSFGSPVEAEVPASTLNVSFRHVDDPVSALAGGGSGAGTGAVGSFTVERMGDPLLGMRDLEAPAHAMDGYIETAALVDASADPRVDGVRDVLRELGGAASVEVVEYAAERS
ncbi:alpha/beta hydrolase [Micromonospora sp. DT81.3]|uniref:alpha/beta hydrolase n=1 Tax=Micromonospora sp. DT81.3 TaxID=3416523 RepID=UPI003CF80542